MPAPQQVLGGGLADRGVVGHDLIAPERLFAIGHEPDSRQVLEPRLHARTRSLAVKKQSIDAALGDVARELERIVWIRDEAEDEAQVAPRRCARDAAQEAIERRRGARAGS